MSKKTVLKILSIIGATGSCIGVGIGLLKLYSDFLLKLGIDESYTDAHPVKGVIACLVGLGLIVALPAFLIFELIWKAQDWIEKKIDGMRDDKNHIDIAENDAFEG